MTSYATLGGVVDRFLEDYQVDPEDVIGVDLDTTIRLHLYRRVDGLDYILSSWSTTHHVANLIREDVSINIVYVSSPDKEEAA